MDKVLVGGLDFNCSENVIGGMDDFGAVTRSFNDKPEEACRPFDQGRSGTVLSDGGALLLLESQDSIKRSCTVYGEITGFGQTSDAFHALRPTDSGIGLTMAIRTALQQAGL